jgi:hypothetical protein
MASEAIVGATKDALEASSSSKPAEKTFLIPDIEALPSNNESATLSSSVDKPPTEEEAATLRRVYGSIPWIAWTLCLVEAAERASCTFFFIFFVGHSNPGPSTS